MLPQRTPLYDTDSNQRYRGPELTPYQRGMIIGTREAGSSIKEIEDESG